jgi:hypothetical protein
MSEGELNFLTNTIQIRGKPYVVGEMDARTMADVRKMLETEKWRVEAFVAFRCGIDPKFASEAEVSKLPQIVADKISEEAFRLTKLDETEVKNG